MPVRSPWGECDMAAFEQNGQFCSIVLRAVADLTLDKMAYFVESQCKQGRRPTGFRSTGRVVGYSDRGQKERKRREAPIRYGGVPRF
jgi:hypothetical protein